LEGDDGICMPICQSTGSPALGSGMRGRPAMAALANKNAPAPANAAVMVRNAFWYVLMIFLSRDDGSCKKAFGYPVLCNRVVSFCQIYHPAAIRLRGICGDF